MDDKKSEVLRDNDKKLWFRILCTYLVTVCIGIVLLIFASMFRQDLIDKHISESVSVFEEEGQYPRNGDKEATSVLNNFTDALILEESAVMQFSQLESIFTNPLFFSTNPVDIFSDFATNRDTLAETAKYVRYWQGFRIPIRILLTFANYSEIRLILSWTILLLFVGSALFLCNHTDIRTAIAFAISIIFIKPQVICNSVQYSCCFILAMIFLFFVPWVIERHLEILFFFTCGMVTMFFDFYTAPLITLGYSLIFLILLKTQRKVLIKESIGYSFVWILGYGIMWITKLLLATVFTEVNGFVNGFNSFAQRTGINKRDDLIQYYNFSSMVKHFLNTVFNNQVIISITVLIFFVLFVAMSYSVVKRLEARNQIRIYSSLLIPVAFMIIWYCISIQPTRIHAYFQYRNISMAIWGLIMFLSIPIKPIKNLGKEI